ncbi:acylneuraminate cytidylyltransferase family protein [Streptococcus merionis]|uniref:acylneuraminate cytidylyltransferase family protein n=1 Tax=Streptococcus merionis TaxID=400065 RepID=UPI0035120E82
MTAQSFIAIITARSGSKALPNKNIQKVGDRTLIEITVEEALASGIFSEIVFSTDSEEYAEILRPYGVTIDMRPQYLAEDTTPHLDTLRYVLRRYPDHQDHMLLQPTSPFRRAEHMIEAYQLYQTGQFDSVVSFTQVDKPTRLITRLVDNKPVDIYGNDKAYTRQSQEKEYTTNGAIYISSKGNYLKKGSYLDEHCGVYLMNKRDSLDIDDEIDLLLANVLNNQ